MDDYSKLFANYPSKVIILTVSSFLFVAMTPFLYSIISFERDSHHRTLINQLMGSIFWIAIIWNFTVQQFDFFRSVFGPMPEYLCRINTIVRNALPMHGLMLIDAILIVKYMFMFHMKNPTAVQDDFWNLFLNMFVAMFTLTSQVITIMSPGPSAPNFFVCIGRFPDDCSNCPTKKNYPATIMVIVSVLVYTVVGFRYLHNKYWTLRNEHKLEPKQNFRIGLSKNTIVSFTTNGVFLFMTLLCFIVLRKVNMIKLENLNDPPNDLWFYTLHYTLPSLTDAVVVFVYFIKTKELRRHVYVELCYIAKMFNFERGTGTKKI